MMMMMINLWTDKAKRSSSFGGDESFILGRPMSDLLIQSIRRFTDRQRSRSRSQWRHQWPWWRQCKHAASAASSRCQPSTLRVWRYVPVISTTSIEPLQIGVVM